MRTIQYVIVILLLACAPIRCVALDYTSYSGMSEAPVAQMRSTSVWANQRSDVRAAGTQMSGYNGIYTAASAVRGGVTTYDSYNPANDGYRANGVSRMPGVPNVFPSPIDADGLGVLFMAVLAAGYAVVVWKKKHFVQKVQK